MQQNNPWNPESQNQLRFHGDGASLFEIVFINFLLKIITLGFYHPWARERRLKYVYGQTSFKGQRFEFHGTGREMFLGYIKGILLVAAFYAIFIFVILSNDEVPNPSDALVILAQVYGLMLAFFLIIFPLAIHGAMKYRMAKTSWSGIRFGYRGHLGEFMKLFAVNGLLTLITLGLYGPWFIAKMYKYLFNNTRFGDAQFSFTGRGTDLFVLYLKFIFLTPLTLGIYLFWFYRDYYRFLVGNLVIQHRESAYRCTSIMTVGQMFRWTVVNSLLIFFTLGIGKPWADVRTLRYTFGGFEIDPAFDPTLVTQNEQDYSEAMGEDLSDWLDLGFV
ncbi:MAG TPA: DUF898 family protein [Luteibaculaceae bacterium]|nr:DUF898 family protein [Luteibaculaceae bacterium]